MFSIKLMMMNLNQDDCDHSHEVDLNVWVFVAFGPKYAFAENLVSYFYTYTETLQHNMLQ